MSWSNSQIADNCGMEKYKVGRKKNHKNYQSNNLNTLSKITHNIPLNIDKSIYIIFLQQVVL